MNTYLMANLEISHASLEPEIYFTEYYFTNNSGDNYERRQFYSVNSLFEYCVRMARETPDKKIVISTNTTRVYDKIINELRLRHRTRYMINRIDMTGDDHVLTISGIKVEFKVYAGVNLPTDIWYDRMFKEAVEKELIIRRRTGLSLKDLYFILKNNRDMRPFQLGGIINGHRTNEISMVLNNEPITFGLSFREICNVLASLGTGELGNPNAYITNKETKKDVKTLINLKLKMRSKFDKRAPVKITLKIKSFEATGDFEEITTYGEYAVVRPVDYQAILVGGTGMHNCLRMDHHLVTYDPKNIYFLVKLGLKNPFKVCIYLNHGEIKGRSKVKKAVEFLKEKPTEIRGRNNDRPDEKYNKTLARFLFYTFDYSLKNVMKINSSNHNFNNFNITCGLAEDENED